MKVLIAGASGLVGSALVAAARNAGHQVVRLVRGTPDGPDAIAWHPAAREVPVEIFQGVDAVVNLAGENIGAGRWTSGRRQRIHQGRIDATATLVRGIRAHHVPLLLNASAVGAYGDCGDTPVSEYAAFGDGFLARVCRDWETEARAAVQPGVRVTLLRFGVVLARDAGMVGKVTPLFRLGLGGRLGSGRQWMSWIHRDDVVGVILAALTDSRFDGPINVVAPAPVTNGEFTATLARTLHRPAFLPAPAWALRLAFGQMADEALLASTRAVPERLQKLGYAFRYPALGPALAAVAPR